MRLIQYRRSCCIFFWVYYWMLVQRSGRQRILLEHKRNDTIQLRTPNTTNTSMSAPFLQVDIEKGRTASPVIAATNSKHNRLCFGLDPQLKRFLLVYRAPRSPTAPYRTLFALCSTKICLPWHASPRKRCFGLPRISPDLSVLLAVVSIRLSDQKGGGRWAPSSATVCPWTTGVERCELD